MGAHRLVAMIVVLAAAAPAYAQRGVPQGGFPSWQERVMLVYVNRSRADPVADLAGCTVCAEKACYSTPLVPLAQSFQLNRAGRFHGANLEFTGAFQHDSPCSLVTDLASRYVPVGTCLGEVACSCVGGTQTGSTPFGTRLSRFISVSTAGENIAYGYSTPRQTFYQWLWEPDSNPACGFRSANGHRYNILGTNYRQLGAGYYRISRHMWVQDFGGGSAPTGTLIAGAHEPQFTGGTIDFRVNYYDTGGPQEALVNVDGACSPMTRERGSATNGTYLASQSLTGTACRRYRFEFRNPAGALVYLPETGSYGAGGSTSGCEDWNASTPPACGAPPNQPPMIAMAAAATPSPVTGATTQLSVLGSDDAGEGTLTYTWAASGPASVAIAPNGNNAAKNATATFSRAGAYSFTVTLRDAGNLTTTSSVAVDVDQTPTAIAVAPPTASVPAGGMQSFAATVYDQFSVALAPQPGKTWMVSGGGTIDTSGVFAAGTAVGGPHTVTASAAGQQGTAAVSVVGPGAPTVAAAATATPDPVDGTTTMVSVLGASGGGEPALTYTWSSAGPAPVEFAPNGDNAAKAATATFALAGDYTLTAQIADTQGQTATSSTTVTVNATPTTVDVMPRTAVVVINTTRAFTGYVADQFGEPADATATWAVDGGGTIDDQGQFTAGATPGGPFTITAAAGGATGTAQILVAEMADTAPPTITIVAPVAGDEVTGMATIVADAADDLGVARVVFTVGGVELTATGAPWQVAWDTTALAEGEYTIEARAYDFAENPSVPAAVTVMVRLPGEAGGCGCATAEGGDAALLALVVLALAGGRRRRRALHLRAQ